MKFILFLVFFVAVSAISDIKKFDEFKTKFHKIYSSEEEEAKRFVIFQQNLRIIETHNQKFLNGETLHKMGVTRFADKTENEFFDKENQKIFNINKLNLGVSDPHRLKGYCWPDFIQPQVISSPPNADDDLPVSIDYRDRNIVMPPRDRGDNNNDDFAFAIADNLEVCLAIHNGTVEYLSPQYVKDCSSSLSDAYFKAFLNGLPRQVDYPLIDGRGECKELCTGVCFGFSVLAHEEIITNVVGFNAPVTIYFDGGDLALYESGIIDGSNCYYNPDEYFPDPSKWRKPYVAVVIGYGTENGTNYWIIKNSWGTSWGENGYFRLIKDKLACGIEAYPVAPDYEDPEGTCNN